MAAVCFRGFKCQVDTITAQTNVSYTSSTPTFSSHHMRYVNRPITEEEAARAIYLDFEGRGKTPGSEDPPPAFAGILVEGKHSFNVNDPKLKDFAQSGHAEFQPLDDFLDAIKRRAESEKRRVVFWSSHERCTFEKHNCALGHIGFDVKLPAKKAYRTTFDSFKNTSKRFRNPDTSKTKKKTLRTKSFGLLTILAGDLGLNRPHNYGPGKVGKWIQDMLRQASMKSSYALWAKGTKAAATKLRKHNLHDCKATQHVLMEMLKERQSLK